MLGVLAACVLEGCSGANQFSCQSDEACAGGFCEAQGWCSFPDDACESGRRFGDHSGAGLAGVCVDPVDGGSGGGSDGASDGPMTSAASTVTTDPVDGSTGPDPTTGGGTLLLDGTSTGDASTGGTGSEGTSTGGERVVHVGPLEILDDADDGQMYMNGMNLVWLPSGEMGNSGFAGEYPEGERYFGYFRFELPIEIVDGATIENAVLSLFGQTPYVWQPEVYAMGIWVEDIDDAPAVQSPSQMPTIGAMGNETVLMLRPESVRWPEQGGLPWAVGEWNDTPDLGELLTLHVAAQGGLVAGSHVQLWVAMHEPNNALGEIGFAESSAFPDLAARLELDVVRP